MPGAGAERELIAPVDLCDAAGRLSPAAVGWSRRPLHRCNLRGSPGRKKRWDYWCVTAPDLFVAITYADIDYLGIANIWVLQPSTGLEVLVDRVVPFAAGFALPERSATGRMTVSVFGMQIDIEETDAATLLRASCAGTKHGALDIDLRVERPPGHESLSVVIPWSDRRFQYTTKDNARRVTGTVRIGATTQVLAAASGAFGAYDAGRGLWKYANRWNWASASGVNADGHVVGLQFGGQWTVGTGYTENALCVDGRLHKIGNELEWRYDLRQPLAPWRVRDAAGGRIDAVLVPVHCRHTRVSIGVLAMEVRQCFGHWSGSLVTDGGETVRFDGLLGFAEEARNRW